MARLQICLLMNQIFQAQTLLTECTSGNLMPNVSAIQITRLEKLRHGLGVRVYYAKRTDLYEHELGETSLSNQIRDGENQAILIWEGANQKCIRVYEGEWKSNMRHGFGFELFLSGSFYIGWHKKDKAHGKGKFINK
jgi:hypothetical protein